MKYRIATGSALAVALLCGYAIAADLKSGPQAGERLPGPFHVLNAFNCDIPSVNGTKTCLV